MGNNEDNNEDKLLELWIELNHLARKMTIEEYAVLTPEQKKNRKDAQVRLAVKRSRERNGQVERRTVGDKGGRDRTEYMREYRARKKIEEMNQQEENLKRKRQKKDKE